MHFESREDLSRRSLARICAAWAAIHSAIVWLHGEAHEKLGVALSDGQAAYAILVVSAGPVVGATIAWTRGRPGVVVSALAALGALLFAGYNHYVAVSADHIDHLPQGPAAAMRLFVVSAHALTVWEILGILLFLALLRRRVAGGGGPDTWRK